MDIEEDQEAQDLIKQIGSSVENKNSEIEYLLSLSKNNIIAKQYIEKNQDTIFEKMPNLLLKYNDNEIVKNFVDNLHNKKEQYDIIKSGLIKYLKNNPKTVLSNLDTPIIKLYSKDLLADQDFKTLLDNDLTKTKNKSYFFLSQKYENNSIIKDFVERNPKHIKEILETNPSYLMDYSGSKVVQNFTKNLKKGSEQYNIIKKYFKNNPDHVLLNLNTPIIKLYSEDLLAEQDFKTLLDNDLKKPGNNWFFLSQEYEKNGFIKDFVERNPEHIKEILETNLSYLRDFSGSQVVQQYQKAQKVIEKAQKVINQIDLTAENRDDTVDNEIVNLIMLSKSNNIFAKQFIEKNQNKIFEKWPDLLLYNFMGKTIVQDFVDKLATNPEQYEIIKNRLTKYLKNNPKTVLSNLDTPIIKLYSKDLLAEQDFKTLLDNELKKPENKHFFLSPKYENNSIIKDLLKDQDFKTLLDNELKKPENKSYFLSPEYENNSIIKDFVERNSEHIEQIIEQILKDPFYLNVFEDSKVVQQYQKAQKVIEEAQKIINQIDLTAENRDDTIDNEIVNLIMLSKSNNIFVKQFIEKNLNKIFEKKPDLLLNNNDNKIVKNFVDKLAANPKQYEIIKSGLKEYFIKCPSKLIEYQDTPIVQLYSKDLLADKTFMESLHNKLKEDNIQHKYFLSPEYANNGFIKDFVERNPDPINKILTDNPDYINEYKDSEVVKTFTANSKLLRSQKDHIIMGEQTQKFVSRERKSTTIRSQESSSTENQL